MVYGAMLAKSWRTSQGQPVCGSRRAAMMPSSRAMPPSASATEPVLPWQGGIAERDEIAVEDGVALIVGERPPARIEHRAAGGLEHALRRRGIPFAGRAETRIHV